MKQVVQSLSTGEILLQEVPPPTAQAGMLLVQSRCSAISIGTERETIKKVRQGLVGAALQRPELVKDLLRTLAAEGPGPTLEKVRARLEEPLALGYSAAGAVQEAGDGVEGFEVGDPVACAGTGYASHAEILCVPKILCVRIPEGVSWEEASFSAMGAIAVQAVRAADLRLGETVAVIGLGMVGQLIAQAAAAAGCRVFGMDSHPNRVAMALELGMTGAAESKGFDAVIIAAATRDAGLLASAGEMARERGIIVVVGDFPMEVPRKLFYEKELQLRIARSYGPGRYDASYERHGIDYPFSYVRWTAQRNMEAFLQLAAAGKIRVSPLITHRFPFEQATEAYRLITEEKTDGPLGVVLHHGANPVVSLPKIQPEKAPAPVPSGSIGLGIIGPGRFARGVLLPALRRIPGVELRGVSASRGIIAKQVAARAGASTATTDYRSLFQDPEIQAVVIATPHHLHAKMVEDSLKAGRHIFVEKPLCLTEEELGRIASLLQSAPRPLVLSVGFNRRFSWTAELLKSWLADKPRPLSILYRVNAGPSPKGGWQSDPLESGGRFLGEVGHFIDLMIFLTGSLPTRVTASAPRQNPRSGENSLVANFSFQDGSLGTLSYLVEADVSLPKERVEIFTEGGVAVLDDFRSVTFHEKGRRRSRGSLFQEKGFRKELTSFVQAIRKGGPSPIPFPQLFAATLATFRMVESARLGKALEIQTLPDAP